MDQVETAPERDAPHSIAPKLACALAARLAAGASGIVVEDIAANSRKSARTASARQIGMYLAHTVFGLSLKSVGEHFSRDRTTAAHACRLVEERRDDRLFDEELAELEDLLLSLSQAIAGDAR